MSGIDEMHPDLRWLAENVSEWASQENLSIARKSPIGPEFYDPERMPYGYGDGHTKAQWLQARKDLGLIMSDEEMEIPAEAAGQSSDNPKRSKYHVEIKPGVWVDVYDVLVAYNVTNPADAHAIKKMLMPGQRGAKDASQDREEAIASLVRAGELGQ